MLFNLVVNDFVNKTSKTINIYTDARNAYNAMEEFIADFILEKEGVQQNNFVKFPLYNTEKKPGYFVEAKRGGFTVKKLVSEKVCQPGWIKNTYTYNNDISKIFNIQIVVVNPKKIENSIVLRKFPTFDEICYVRYESTAGLKSSDVARRLLGEFIAKFTALECFAEIENNTVSALRSLFPREFLKCLYASDVVLQQSKIEFSQSINNKILNAGAIVTGLIPQVEQVEQVEQTEQITESLITATSDKNVSEEWQTATYSRKHKK